jgi:uncharacterized membrane protein
MSWIVFALSAPTLWAISTHLDKYLLERYFKQTNVAVLLIFTSFAGLIFLPFIWWFDPTVIALSLSNICLIALAGILYMSAMFFYLHAIQSEEASVVAPFFQASALFGYVLGYMVLGETLTGPQLLGGVLIISGAALVSISFGNSAKNFNGRLAVLMLMCALVLSLSSLIFKVFALQDDFWPTTFWMFVGQAVFGAVFLAFASFRRQFFSLLRSNTGALLAINGANEMINIGGGLGGRYALVLAPMSLVQAVGSTTTLFVFIFGVALTAFFPSLGRENLSLGNLAQKGLAALLVAAGIFFMHQFG